jgi:hypothetical protein
LAGASTAENRLLYRMPPETLEKTVLVKEQAKPQQNEKPNTE